MVVIAIFRVIKAPFIDGNLSIIDCYAEAVHVFRNFVHVIKNRLVGAPVHVIEKTVHVHENCCSRVLRILNAVNMDLANHKTKQDVVEMPIGAKLALDLAPVAGWTIAPSLDINVVPTFGDRDVTTTNYGVDVTTDVLNRGLFNTRLGVTGTNGAWGFNADIGFSAGSADTEGVFARVGVNYAF